MKKRSMWQARARLAAVATMRGDGLPAPRSWAEAAVRAGSDAALLFAAMRLTGYDADALTVGVADRGFSQLLDLSARSIRSWRTGTKPLPGPVFALCRLIVARPENARLVVQSARTRSRAASRVALGRGSRGSSRNKPRRTTRAKAS